MFKRKKGNTEKFVYVSEIEDSSSSNEKDEYVLVDGEEKEIDGEFEELFNEIEDEQSGENNLEVIVDNRIQNNVEEKEIVGNNNILDNDLSESLLSNIAKGNIGVLEDVVIKLENLKGYLVNRLVIDESVDRELNHLFSSVIENDEDKFNSTQMSYHEYVALIHVLFNRLLNKELPSGTLEFQRYSYERYISNYHYALEDELVDIMNTIFLELESKISNVDERVSKFGKVKDTIENTRKYKEIINITTNVLQYKMKHNLSVGKAFSKISDYVNQNYKK